MNFSMVHTSVVQFASKKVIRSFVDGLRVYVRGGPGGQGLPKYGGIGGRGGHVYVVAKEKASLKKLKNMFPEKRFIAGKGENSSGRALQGPAGEDIEIEVPPGVCVRADNGIILGEVNEVGDKVLAARGGSGGSPQNGFVAEKGHQHSVNLDLKLIADIGLVGFPNAGKSTLLKALSRASPKIASYPFTTIQPQIGILEYDDHRQISMADLPGLIEGAHINIGMGHKFLKHVERTKLLLFIVDIQGFRLNLKHELRTAFETVALLNKELELYKEELLSKPAVLVLNKIDQPGSDLLLNQITEKTKHMEDHIQEISEALRPKTLVKFDEIIAISAKKLQNTDYLKTRLRQLLDLYADIEFEGRSKQTKELALIETSMVEHIGLRGV